MVSYTFYPNLISPYLWHFATLDPSSRKSPEVVYFGASRFGEEGIVRNEKWMFACNAISRWELPHSGWSDPLFSSFIIWTFSCTNPRLQVEYSRTTEVQTSSSRVQGSRSKFWDSLSYAEGPKSILPKVLGPGLSVHEPRSKVCRPIPILYQGLQVKSPWSLAQSKGKDQSRVSRNEDKVLVK